MPMDRENQVVRLSKQPDDQLRQKAHLDELFATVPEAIVLLDTDARILRVDPEFTRIFGYAEEEALGRLINEPVAPEELRAEAEEYTRRGIRGETLNVETVRELPNRNWPTSRCQPGIGIHPESRHAQS